MTTVTFLLPDGTAQAVDASGCATLMHAAMAGNVAGMECECGGQLICATCQVYVEPEWRDRLPPASPDEQDMIGDLAVEVRPESRLACQLPAPDGLVVRVPARQR